MNGRIIILATHWAIVMGALQSPINVNNMIQQIPGCSELTKLEGSEFEDELRILRYVFGVKIRELSENGSIRHLGLIDNKAYDAFIEKFKETRDFSFNEIKNMLKSKDYDEIDPWEIVRILMPHEFYFFIIGEKYPLMNQFDFLRHVKSELLPLYITEIYMLDCA